MRLSLLTIPVFIAFAGCDRPPSESRAASNPEGASPSAPVPRAVPAAGKTAPDFTLKDLDGKEVQLASFKGKTVVLEWFNPGCPFVKAAHTKGSLKTMARRDADKGVVWLAVNSSAPGKQGAGAEANREAAKTFGLAHPILLDESGEVGKMYGATNTPHMFVIDATGQVVYRGAIDNSPDGEGESAPGGKLVNYVEAAIEAIGANRPVTVAETKAYGCSVKYK